jgi:DNA repair protein RadA/Sms
MKNKELIFVCSNCGNEYSKWQGQCSACGQWNSLKEIKGAKIQNSRFKKAMRVEVKNLSEINKNSDKKQKSPLIFSTGIKEFDRVLGKGIVQGAAVLFAGEPGIGKSTLLTQLVGKIGGLYVAGEESAEQIGLRVERLGLNTEKFDILETNRVEEIEEYLDRVNNVYKIAVVDSIQTMVSESQSTISSSRAGVGSVGQIRETTFRLVQLAKQKNITIFIVGHVTKEGDIAGPKILEHMVDTVLYFEGEKNGDLRMLRTTKNRFGATDEVGVFKMEEKGLREIGSEEINLISGENNLAGKAVTVTLEGSRPMLVEIQALVVESFAPMPKRVFSGIDYNRGQLLVAIGQKSLGMPLFKCDVFVAVSGGIRIEDTGADLAVLVAMWSSYKSAPLSVGGDNGGKKIPVYVGEVSLLGEVKRVRGWEKRKKEAELLGRKMV